MTVYGWDASNHDWARGAMDLPRARKEGISLFTHKVAEGHLFYKDPYFRAAMARAKIANFPVVGGYFVPHPGTQEDQADWFVGIVTNEAPWWKDHPCFIWQIDAEKFDYMARAPSVSEINVFGDRVMDRTGCAADSILVYAPNWLYGDGLSGLRYRNLWSSAYVNGIGSFKGLYPGDNGTGFQPYSGITPTVWQYTSSATIAGQGPCDANAIRVATEADMVALFKGVDMSLTDADVAKIWAFQYTHVDEPTNTKNSKNRSMAQWLTNIPFAINDLPTTVELKAELAKIMGVPITDAQAQAIADLVVANMPASGGFDITSTVTPK
jgi:hypothetical protein